MPSGPPVRVSIHAPAWGATKSGEAQYLVYPSFNPRTRVGCDDAVQGADNNLLAVSIHAPAWGATCLRARR